VATHTRVSDTDVEYHEPPSPRAVPVSTENDAIVAKQRPASIRHNSREIAKHIAIGTAAATAAVAIRYSLRLPSETLPSFTVVIAVCLVTLGAGVIGGVATTVVGGLLTWYFIMPPTHSFRLDGPNAYSLVGYFGVTSVIICTSQLYRRSEQIRQAAALSMARQEAEHQHLFAREISHRLKNAMAIVQALARQTFDHDAPEMAKFDGRLRALADAHSLLSEHIKQPTASVLEIVTEAMIPFGARDRIRMHGPALMLPSQQVVSLALALHELGTNAVKYGALSKTGGWISIDWDMFDQGLVLEWKEHDGPPVSRPTSSGFGLRLLQRSAMGAQLEFEADGLRCTMTLRY